MKSYRNIAVGITLVLALAAVARGVQVATRPVESQNTLLAQANTTVRPAAQQPQGGPAGTAGPASDLLRLMGVNQPDFGIKVVRSFDTAGKAAYETKGGDLLFFTNASVSYNSTADKPMIIVIDARARKIIAVADVDIQSTPHGITLSPDGRYIYLPSGPSVMNRTGGRADGFLPPVDPSPTAVIDAKTLKLAALINTGGSTHHSQIFADKYVMFDSFRGPLPIFLLDPANNTVIRGIPAGDFNGRPYIGFPSPDGKFIYATVRPGINRDSHGREIDGWLSKINAETMQQVATFPV